MADRSNRLTELLRERTKLAEQSIKIDREISAMRIADTEELRTRAENAEAERDEMRAVLNQLADEYVADYARWIASFKNDPEALLRAMRRTGKSYRPRLPEWVFQYASKESVTDYP